MPGEGSWEVIKISISAVIDWAKHIQFLGISVFEWGFYAFLLATVWGFLLQPLFGGRDLVSPGSDAVVRGVRQKRAEKAREKRRSERQNRKSQNRKSG